MCAPVSQITPDSPAPVAVNPPRRNMAPSTRRLLACRAGPESLRRLASSHQSWPPMRAPARWIAPSGPAPVAVNPPIRISDLVDLHDVSVQRGAGVVAQACPGAVQLAADVGTGQVDRAIGTGADGGEPAVQEHALVDAQAVGLQGGAGAVAQARPPARQLAADVAAGQVDRAGLGVADDRCLVQAERAAGEPFGVQGRLGGVFEVASGQVEVRQAGIPGEEAFLQITISQLKVDIRGEVCQVKPADDPGRPKLQPMRIGVGASRPRKMSRITHARQVRESPHDRIAASSITSSSAARSSHSPWPTCSTSDCSTEVNAP